MKDCSKIQDEEIENTRLSCIKNYGQQVLTNETEPYFNKTLNKLFCPPIFDSIVCWPYTEADTLSVKNCPKYFVGFKEDKIASRFCTENGTWFILKNDTPRYWTNYSQCYDSNNNAKVECSLAEVDDENGNLKVSSLQEIIFYTKNLAQVGYGLSLTSLIIALCILLFIKKLHCPRNKLHMHLFASFILKAFFSLLKFKIFVKGIGFSSDLVHTTGKILFNEDIKEHNWNCKLYISLWQYSLIANYTWILMEGLYLHNIVFRALFSDTHSVINYVIFGWTAPALITILWVIARLLWEDTLCWTTNHTVQNTIWILHSYIILTVLVNFLLFIRITAMIMSKLRSVHRAEIIRFKKWARSTLVLVPLFGVHYFLFELIYFFSWNNYVVELIWLIIDQLFTTFQGFFVAVLYCFMNGEVLRELKLYSYDLMQFWNSSSCCTCLKFPRSPKRSSVGTMESNTSLCAIHLNQINPRNNHILENNGNIALTEYSTLKENVKN